MKKLAVGNLGEEEAAQLKHTVLTRAATRVEADLLFHHKASEIAAKNRARLAQLFVQAPGAETMAPTIVKSANKDCPSEDTPEDKKEKKVEHAAIGDKDYEKKNPFAHEHGKHGKLSKKIPKLGDGPKKLVKKSSVTYNVDRFFDKLAAENYTDAQRRYPELLKVAVAPGLGTRPSPNVTKRCATEAKGAQPARSSLSGGSA